MTKRFNYKILILMLTLGSISAHAKTETCSYELAKDSVAIGWTAFKTTQKVAVNGAFKKFDLKGKAKANSLSRLLKGLSVSIDKSSLDSGNPARDKTLQESFFDLLAKSISGTIKNVSESDKTFVLTINFNGQKKDIPMHYEVTDEQFYKATGSIDLMDFAAKAALDSLNAKCQDLHKGADGVSKTWSEVGLNLKATVTHNCQ